MTAATRERRPPPGNAGNAEPQQEPTIRPGYKQTEVGIIPEDWEVKRLGDIYTSLRAAGAPGRWG